MDKGNRKELGIDNDEIYLKLSNEYKKYFEIYLSSKVNLSNFDKQIKECPYGFGITPYKIKLKSNLDEFLHLDYLYILNDFLIEKLNLEQINILKSDTEVNKLYLVENTYKDIIKNNYINGSYSNKVFKINYIDDSSELSIFDNDSLVIAIFYGSNTEEYNTKTKYLENYENKKRFMNSISMDIKNKISDVLDIKCEVIYRKI